MQIVNAPGKCKLKRIACQADRVQLMAAYFKFLVSGCNEITSLCLVYALEDASRRRSAPSAKRRQESEAEEQGKLEGFCSGDKCGPGETWAPGGGLEREDSEEG
jgi:hypothetical protein